MTSTSLTYDLARASEAVYRPWVRYYVFGIGIFIVLISLPYTVPVATEILRGHPVTITTWAVFLAIVCAGYGAAGFAIAGGLTGLAPRPVRMILDRDRIWLVKRSGHRVEIDWTNPRFRLVLWDQSEFAARAGSDGDPGFRMVGVLSWRAILTRAAFDALIQEATRRGLSVVRHRPSRWSVAAVTPGTLVYRICRSLPRYPFMEDSSG